MELITIVLSQDIWMNKSVISPRKFDSMEVLFATVLSLDYVDMCAPYGKIVYSEEKKLA